jgi:GNAT superfamily N-acetyltransferase
MVLTIRLAAPLEDRTKLDALFAAMLRHFGSQSPAAAEQGKAADIMTHHPSCEVMLAERDGEPLGFATFSVIFPDADLETILYVRAIFVLAEARSQGIGAELMRRLAELALRRGCARIEWATENKNEAAQAFYQRMGATELSHAVNYKLAGEALRALAED